jgi:hypothetical protein
VNPEPPVAVKATQALAASLVLAGVMLLVAVGRGVYLVLSPNTRAIFEQTQAGTPDAAAYSVVLGYGVPALVFTIGYAVVALRVTRGRRWTWVLGLLLSVGGVVLCFTTVSQLLSYAAWVMVLFQALLALSLLAGSRYFWSSAGAEAGDDGDSNGSAAATDAAPSIEAAGSSSPEAAGSA